MNWHRFYSRQPPAPRFEWARCAACDAPIQSDGAACTGRDHHPVEPPTVRLYATWTGTAINLAALHAIGGRLLAGPDQLDRWGPPPLAWAVDNGAWGCHQRGVPFDGEAFARVLDRWGVGADWIALPDIVAGGLASLELSVSWLNRVRAYGRPALLVVQDGMVAEDLVDVLDQVAGIFVGGTTAWKWATLPAWGALCRERGLHLHVGRVNSARRIRLAAECGASSVDGTNLTQFSVNAPRLGRAADAEVQPWLFEESA